jgi:hypothetical protein
VPVAEILPWRSPWLSGYYENQQLKFLFNGGNYWWHFQSGSVIGSVEQRRHQAEGTHHISAVLNENGRFFSIPTEGGQYHTNAVNNQWAVAGVVNTIPQAAARAYFSENQLNFIYLGGNQWRIITGQQYVDLVETRRFSAQQYGTESAQLVLGQRTYAIPLDGGVYHYSDSGGEWQPAGNLVAYPIF